MNYRYVLSPIQTMFVMIMVLLIIPLQSSSAQSLAPDNTFGLNGWVFTNTFGLDEMGYAFEILPDGKIIAAGSVQRDTDNDGVFNEFGIGLYRYNSDGSVDSTFGTNGFSYFTGFQIRDPRGLVVQSDGKILITGGSSDLMVMRVNPGGSLDNSFGSNGVVTFNVIDFRQPNRGNDIIIDSSGRIVVIGDASGFSSGVVVRLLSDGSLDTSFNNGAGGVNFPSGAGGGVFWSAIQEQPDGKYVIGGAFNDAGNRNISVIRIQSNGALDSTFAGTGRVIKDLGTPIENVEALAIQDDGKIVYTGFAGQIPNRDIMHGRLNADGTDDETYADFGSGILSLAGNDVASDLRILPDGKILIAGHGSATSVSNTDFLLYQLNPDGSEDTAFGDNSAVIFADFNNDADVVREMAIQSDGDVILFGDTEVGFNTEYFAALRFRVPPPQNTFVVTNTNDSGAGSLRQVLTDANATENGGKPDRVIFNIPTSDPGYDAGTGTWEIAPQSAYPELTDPIIIDGLDGGITPLIEINGSAVTASDGLRISAGRSTVQGLIINRFENGAGISLDGSNQNDIRYCYIGTDPTGLLNEGNGSFGVFVDNSAQNRIRNSIISGNNVGVFIQQSGSIANNVLDNYIGLGSDGTTAIPNEVEGVRLVSGVRNTLIENNFISGNSSHGVGIYSSSNNDVWSNRIGTNSAGTQAVGNGGSGVYILDSGSTRLGSSGAQYRNIISGNSGAGISVVGTSIQNFIQGNYIGTDITGSVDLGNGGGGGVFLGSENGNTVQENLISGNGGDPSTAGPGVTVSSISRQNSIRQNLIGYNASGDQAIGNANNGILLLGDDNLIRDNSIAGNGRSGIEIAGGSSNTICGNKIGMVFAETAPLFNDFFGIWINSGASDNTIGGSSGCSGNQITDDLIAIQISGDQTSNNTVIGNLIGGTESATEIPIQGAINVVDADSNSIGGLGFGAGNKIYSTTTYAMRVVSNTGIAVANAFKGNTVIRSTGIGLDINGDGVTANDAGDADSGNNNLQNYPVISSMVYDSVNNQVTLEYELDTDPANAAYPINVDFYLQSGDRQPVLYLGTDTILENEAGAPQSPSYNNSAFLNLAGGAQVIAMATDDGGNSSEFSAPVSFDGGGNGGGGGTDRTFIVTNTSDSGAGSLRQAILDANAAANGAAPDSIVFEIPAGDPGYESGSGIWTIQPQTALPEITDPVIMEGAAEGQPPRIEIGGAAVTTGDGLVVSAGNTTVRGLIINNFGSGSGIVLQDGSSNLISGNYVGTDDSGTTAEGNSEFGIRVISGSGNTIQNNLVSGNGITGIRIDQSSSSNIVRNNVSGLDLSRNNEVGNDSDGISIWGDNNSLSFNWSSGNTGSGITIRNGSGNELCGNRIGVNSSADQQLPNGRFGVYLRDGASDNTIGDPQNNCGLNVITDDGFAIRIIDSTTTANRIAGNLIGTNENGDDLGGATGIYLQDASSHTIGTIAAGNTIAFMSSRGIIVSNNNGGAEGNSVRGNIFINNASLGFDLGLDNVTANDAGDADEGPNRLQNYPVISSMVYDSVNNQVTLEYELDTDPANAAYPINVDFYLQNGDRQPVIYLGTDTILENEAGAPQTPSYNNSAFLNLAEGAQVIAMATDDAGNSSEFSAPKGFDAGNGGGGGGDADSTFVVTNTSDSGAGSLRQAILDANAAANGAAPDSIVFEIPAGDPGYESGSGTWTIQPQTALPEITDPVIMEGAAEGQPPRIEISGAAVTTGDGLVVSAGNTTVRGLIINNFGSGSGIVLQDKGSNLISGNYIGTDQSGTAAEANGESGIEILSGSANSIRGNLISGNTGSGVLVEAGSSDNSLENNTAGTDLSRSSVIPNGAEGMDIRGNSNQVIGNWVSGNTGSGLYIRGASANRICANHIGVNGSDDQQLANGNYGIHLLDGASGNIIGDPSVNCASNLLSDDEDHIRIGGTQTTGNTVKANLIGTNQSGDDLGGETGIFVRDATSNIIGSIAGGNVIANMNNRAILISDNSGQALGNDLRGNIYLDNAVQGVDLGGELQTPNDAGDVDEGPNRNQNFPVIAEVVYDTVGQLVSVTYELDTDPANAGYPINVDFYLQGGEGQAIKYLGTDSILENEAGSVQDPSYNNAAFLSLEADDLIIAMATDADGNSSEFSQAVAVSLPAIVSNEEEFGNPSRFELMQNYPNPFNPTTVIGFSIPAAAEVRLEVYNLLGQKVGSLVDQRLNAGYHEFDFDASGLPSGIYLYRIEAGRYSEIRKMMLIK